jgi:hypothetical protein
MSPPKVKQEVEQTGGFPVEALLIAQSLCSATSHTIALVRRTLAFVLLSWLPPGALCADLAQIERCRTVTDAAERLACFDRAAAAAPKALEPSPQDFGKPAPPPAQVSKVSAGLREFARSARGGAVFVLDNGQTWGQIESDTSVVREPVPGVQVTIERGIFDTYNLSLSGWNGMVKVRRLQ